VSPLAKAQALRQAATQGLAAAAAAGGTQAARAKAVLESAGRCFEPTVP